MSFSAPILRLDELSSWRDTQKLAGLRVVLTNGCFDLLHAGHVQYLQDARSYGDLLVVALNSDASVRELKGPERPINRENDRARVLAALRCVDAVTIFSDTRAVEVIRQLRPDAYVKGGDYTINSLDPAERASLETCQTQIHLVGFLPGRSSSQLIEALRHESSPPPV